MSTATSSKDILAANGFITRLAAFAYWNSLTARRRRSLRRPIGYKRWESAPSSHPLMPYTATLIVAASAVRRAKPQGSRQALRT
ncbi:MAG: hypothetical protein QXP98_07850 [Thermoproteus sp.]